MSNSRRLQRLERRQRRPSDKLCQCPEQLEAIAQARVAIDYETGICQFCGLPVASNWSRFKQSLERAYGG
jgi:hypothetical protein